MRLRRWKEVAMTKTIGTLMGLALALAIPTASAIPAPSCPDVEAARAMLAKAAATENERVLKETPLKEAPPKEAPGPGKTDGKEAPKRQPEQAPRAAPAAPTAPDPSPEKKRAALLVKEADEACQAGQTAAASEKAKAAMALLRQ